MVSLKIACHTVQANHPNRRIVRCFDYDSFYGFMTIPHNWNEESMELPSTTANNSMNYIRKDDGKEFFLSFRDCLNLMTDGEEVDIKDYLSSEDAALAMKVQKLIERSESNNS